MSLPRDLTQEEKEKMKAERRKTKDWKPRITEMSSGTRIRNIYSKIKGKFTVDAIWAGGGGNPDIECLTFCQDLLVLMQAGDEEALHFAWAEEEMRP